MPIYEYGCVECGKQIEAFQKINDAPLTVCPECGGELSKMISNTSFVLKGSGWYADGYTGNSNKTEDKHSSIDAKPDAKSSGDSSKTTAKPSAPATS